MRDNPSHGIEILGNILDFKVWQTRVGALILNFYPSAEVVNDVEKGTKLQICFETSLSVLSKGNSKNSRLLYHH